MTEQALLAASQLSKEGIRSTVLNMYSIKPLPEDLLLNKAKETGAFVTAEDHSVIGGLGGAVSEFLSENYPVPVVKIGVHDHFGESGTQDQLYEKYGLTASHIVKAAQKSNQYEKVGNENVQRYFNIKTQANTIRKDILEMIYNAQSGHLGGSFSMVEVLTALYFDEMHYDPKDPHKKDRDRFVLSKGHTAPALYATLANAGYFPQGEAYDLLPVCKLHASGTSGYEEDPRRGDDQRFSWHRPVRRLRDGAWPASPGDRIPRLLYDRRRRDQ